jgi:mono/diheme cytochrome c family protein
MGMLRLLRLSLLIVGFALPASHASTVTNLVFDAITKEYTARVGEPTAEFDFAVTNLAATNIIITKVQASCGCTTPKLPSMPWDIPGGTNGAFHVTVNLAGKSGTFTKSIFMETSEGPKLLYVKVAMPEGSSGAPSMDARTHNQMISMADRQAVFRGDCASCHSKPLLGKSDGEQLFTLGCAICHEDDHRATSVPDLHALKQTPTEAYWDAWVRKGKVGTMMPAFAMEDLGPLTDPQITALVKYLVNDFPNRKPKGAASLPIAPTPAHATIPQGATVVRPPEPPNIPQTSALPPNPTK